MAIGERIEYIRNLRGMTQKKLGMVVGFTEKTADVRMAQYESGARKPKKHLIDSLAQALNVSPCALNVPNIDNNIVLMHTLFTLEDFHAMRVGEVDGEPCILLHISKGQTHDELRHMVSAWREQAANLESGVITKEEYDQWRYRFPTSMI